MSQALYRRWRSQTFEQVVGQEHVTLTLRNALRDGRMSHAYLFTGPRGTGKTSTARILAKAINCLADSPAARPCNSCRICAAINEGRQLDLIEIDAASNRGIDEIRDLRDKISFRPNEARFKVYIIDEVHMLTKEAFNALLKTLEEPPEHAVFVLATTEPDRVPETVRSRCQRFDFRRIPTAEIVEHLSQVLAAEGGRAAPEALVAIARRATGSMRDAVSLLDQLLSYGDDELTLVRVESVLGLVDAQTISRLVDLMAAGDAAGGLALINRLIVEGVELGQLVDQIVAYLRAVLFLRVTRAPDLLDMPQEVAASAARQAEVLSIAALLLAVRAFTEARTALRDQVPGVPQLPIEMALLAATASTLTEPSSRSEMDAPPTGSSAPASAAPASAPVSAAVAPSARPTVIEPSPSRPGPGPELRTAPRMGAAAPSVEPSADADARDAVRANWERFVAQAGKRSGMKVQAALRSVRDVDAVGGLVVLRFSHAFSRDLVGEGENRSQIEALWSDILGRKVLVRCALVGEVISGAPAPVGPSALAATEGDEDAFLAGARDLGAVVKRLA